jgi:hypothetical protein
VLLDQSRLFARVEIHWALCELRWANGVTAMETVRPEARSVSARPISLIGVTGLEIRGLHVVRKAAKRAIRPPILSE